MKFRSQGGNGEVKDAIGLRALFPRNIPFIKEKFYFSRNRFPLFFKETLCGMVSTLKQML